MQPETDPDIGWVERLGAVPQAAAARAVAEAAGERRLFLHLRREHASEGRESYIEIDAPLELHALVRLGRPTHVVEVGVSSGVSSAYLLDALGKNGHGTLHSIDLPSRPRRRARARGRVRASWSLPPGRCPGWAVPLPLRKRWDLRIGDKSDVLPLLGEELPRIDMILYDVPHDEADIRNELRALEARLLPGAIAIVDHGPGGGRCAALQGWARQHGTEATPRAGLGLYGARRPGATRRGRG
jgi:predicted O-methyltransferase YrrM